MSTQTKYAWDRLQDALERTQPDCHEDDRYITDLRDSDRKTRAELTQICEACPVITQCAAYAVTARPPAGLWPTHNLPVRKAAAA